MFFKQHYKCPECFLIYEGDKKTLFLPSWTIKHKKCTHCNSFEGKFSLVKRLERQLQVMKNADISDFPITMMNMFQYFKSHVEKT